MTFRTDNASVNQSLPVFNQLPGDNPAAIGGANSLNAKILVELRIISHLLATQSRGIVDENDLENFRADPSSLGQRLG